MVYTSANLNKIQDEINSLKVAQPINGGALVGDSAQVSWSGTIDKNAPISQYSMMAAFIMTYTRNDGVRKPPLVQFAFSITPDDNTEGAVVAVGEDSVSYKIILNDYWWPDSTSGTTVDITITGYAYSMVSGDLSIERVYS